MSSTPPPTPCERHHSETIHSLHVIIRRPTRPITNQEPSAPLTPQPDGSWPPTTYPHLHLLTSPPAPAPDYDQVDYGEVTKVTNRNRPMPLLLACLSASAPHRLLIRKPRSRPPRRDGVDVLIRCIEHSATDLDRHQDTNCSPHTLGTADAACKRGGTQSLGGRSIHRLLRRAAELRIRNGRFAVLPG